MTERTSVPSKKRIRGLKQYKDLTDEEFDEVWERKVIGIELTKEFEDRIQKKINEFSDDYDLSDLKSNDKLTLRALAQATLQLEDLEIFSYNKRKEGIHEEDILLMEKINNIMSALRRDISKMNDDLKITRRIRKGDKEESLVNFIDDLKKKAKEFYENTMFYIFCPECNILLGTMWFQYPNENKNKIQLYCDRIKENGEKCNTKVLVGSSELLSKRGVNSENIPEFFK